MNLESGPLALALAMFIGVIVQGLSRHARLPGIVLLLFAGVALGPDGANVIRPHAMGGALASVVGFAIAIILFEGGFSLQLSFLRAQAKPIRRLVTIGPIVTGVLAAIAARAIMPWDWRLSVLFGTLVIVTGPTVVTPLVRRMRLSSHMMWILIAEGIFIDAVGATIAVVALEVAIAPSRGEAAAGVLSIFFRFGIGAVVGMGGGLLLVALLRVRRLVPHGLENVLVFATAVACFHVSNSLVSESGIVAVIVAGLIVGNFDVRPHAKVAEFNEQLTALLVATLFVLLAADVRLADVVALGWPGIAVVAVLMLIVRPVNVLASTANTELTWREKLYLSWVAPRGIVAAAVASLFALELERVGVEGGVEMRALVFVVIAATVTIQGLSAAWVGTLLRVRKPVRSGYLILGANPLARELASAVRNTGERVVLVDRSEEACAVAQREGFDVVLGDGLQSAVLEAAGIEAVAHAVGLTANEHVNFNFARTVGEDHAGPELHIALERHDAGITPALAERHDMNVLFGREHDLLSWHERARLRRVTLQRWRLDTSRSDALADRSADHLLPLLVMRGKLVEPFMQDTNLRGGDFLIVAIATDQLDAAMAWLGAHGWIRVEDSGGYRAVSNAT